MSQSLVLMLLGGTVLRISAFSTTYLNYVKPGFRPFLIAAGAVLVVLGVVGLIRDWRRPADTTASTATSTASTSDSVSTSAPASASDSASASAPASTSGSAAASVSASASASGPGSHAGHGGHDHSHVPQVAWLLCLPVFALFLISPPALGSYAAARVDTAPRPRRRRRRSRTSRCPPTAPPT
ncbi:hypothetical protein [Thermocatellispora tengchongensis]|uniref:hypothetical protein n=1 Tax=Thermocatellispora tengchongensis TaxID=1073253 RepID=UPI00363FABF1